MEQIGGDYPNQWPKYSAQEFDCQISAETPEDLMRSLIYGFREHFLHEDKGSKADQDDQVHATQHIQQFRS